MSHALQKPFWPFALLGAFSSRRFATAPCQPHHVQEVGGPAHGRQTQAPWDAAGLGPELPEGSSHVSHHAARRARSASGCHPTCHEGPSP